MQAVLRKIPLLLSFVFLAVTASAEVTLPRFISNGMVLQRDKPIPVWGWAQPGEKVTISFNGKTYSAQTAEDKKWKVNLAATKAGGPYNMTVKGTNTITLQDILVGDVWVCSGQSNMQFTMAKVAEKYKDEVTTATNPKIRHFLVDHTVAYEPAQDVTSKAGWKSADPKTVLNFTAVGYFFAKELFEKYQVPIGLLHTSVGGTPAEAWISSEALKPFPGLQKQIPAAASTETVDPKKEERKPAVLYNAMVAPLLPYAIKGVIWYQGEANANRGKEYRRLFPALITDWRARWGQGDFPFLFVQLANFQAISETPAESKWAELRESQTMTLSLPNTGMAVIHDLGEAKDIHPKNKKDVGLRLAQVAKKVAYGDAKVVYSGPLFKSMKSEKDKLVLTFEHVGGGLVAKDGGELKQFAIAGPDRKFVWANARIEGDKVVVWHESVPNPVAVRYAWANNPEGANLYNKEGLPASSFRTDQ
ncbi:hypothetical protein TH63_11840 [Rufibacter radiotolerans]|uniref:Sialate O-acetylesterase domain-containing protein n=1 Tax=Rufibacter radiotolerans TaxID=1379910 RepID=A0A0H4VQF6_9BACT|nr:sialate O-acetylesterase [Rufibacter radiotolerans]AKQ46167.1 hypothetical protein TH63_11840 [Rufibacter radiotolerans]